ncbi:MAG: hypothetical protein QOH69_2139 [Actinomycetota bacterium]|jgi:hypothetical protein|nr:hypothetical protein [Actinomycetota bacterium]
MADEERTTGWHPDPSNPSVERWWNGISWGDQTRESNGSPIPTATPTTAPRVIDPYAPVARTPPPSTPPATTRDGQFRNVNPIGYIGVALGFVSLLFNVFCVPSFLALIFSAIGIGRAQVLRRSGHRVTGLGWCVAGLIMGIAETLIYIGGTTS